MPQPAPGSPSRDHEPLLFLDVDGRCWTTAPLTRWAEGRPFVWLDDELGDLDRLWVTEQHPAPALLHKIDPYRGITDDDFETVRRWVALEG